MIECDLLSFFSTGMLTYFTAYESCAEVCFRGVHEKTLEGLLLCIGVSSTTLPCK